MNKIGKKSGNHKTKFMLPNGDTKYLKKSEISHEYKFKDDRSKVEKNMVKLVLSLNILPFYCNCKKHVKRICTQYMTKTFSCKLYGVLIYKKKQFNI